MPRHLSYFNFLSMQASLLIYFVILSLVAYHFGEYSVVVSFTCTAYSDSKYGANSLRAYVFSASVVGEQKAAQCCAGRYWLLSAYLQITLECHASFSLEQLPSRILSIEIRLLDLEFKN